MSEQNLDTFENNTNSSSSLEDIQFPLETKLILNTAPNYFKNESQLEIENIESVKIWNKLFPIKDIIFPEITEFDNNNRQIFNDLSIEISEEKEYISNLESSKLFDKKIFDKENKSFLSTKKERTTCDDIRPKILREDNCRIMIGRNFFNKYLKNSIIENMKKACKCLLHLDNFPKKFIREAVKKGNKKYLNYTLEELLENEELYKNNDIEGYYSTNLKVIKELKSDKNKDIMEEMGYNKILKMNYRELFEEYLKSNEFKQKIENLNSKKKFDLEKFENVSNLFIEGFYD